MTIERARSDEQLLGALKHAHGSITGAWRTLGGQGKPTGSFRRRCRRVLAKAAGTEAVPPARDVLDTRAGWSPDHGMTREVAPGMYAKGVSTLYDGDGKVRQQWVLARADREQQVTALIEACRGPLLDEFRGKAQPTRQPESSNADLLAVYPIADVHVGMLAWAPEVGKDFDLSIASRNLRAAVERLVYLAPPAETALLLELGDFFHSDSTANRTLRSGNVLDVDGRWSKVLDVGIRLMRDCVDLALTKHKRVVVEIIPGNHDDHSSVVLQHVMAAFYEREPRVEVNKSPDPFRYYVHGATMIGCAHGDAAKPSNLPAIMAADRAEDWGRTRHRHIYVGHVHHDQVREHPGCTVESVRTLAGRDAWSHREGYRALRDLKLDIWDRRYGRVSRHVVGIDEIEVAA